MSWNWCWSWWRKGDDNLAGTSGRDWLFGGRGNDTIDGGAGSDKLKGGRGDDSIYGGAGNDRVYGGRGDDSVYGGAGNDKVKGGSGDDVVDGGAGNDRVYGGRGDDIGIYSVTENQGSKDYYNGGRGSNDVLVLQMTQAEYDSDAVQADLAAYTAFFAEGGHGWGHHGHSFTFKAFDLKMKNWESIEYDITDAGSHTEAASNDPPEANNDTVFANVGTIAEREPNDPIPNIAAGSAQVIARSSFRIGQTADVDNDLLPRVSIAGSIDPISDVDVYAIDLEAGETLLLDIDYGVDFMNPSASDVDTQIFVMDANGNVLAENDTSSSLLGGAGSVSGFDPFAFFTATSADTYYVAVTSFNNDPTGSGGGTFDGNGMTSGDYVLNISVQDAAADLGGVLILADTLLANDTNSNGDALVITSVGNAVNGTVDLNGDGDVIFTPTSDFSGSFEYTISDTAGNESTATATVSMNGGDAIVGSAFDDVLIGGAGNDVFTGGDGNDAFAFTPGSGDDAITDFTIGSDFMVLADGMSVATFVEQGSDTLVNFDTGDSVLLVGVTGVADANDLFPSG